MKTDIATLELIRAGCSLRNRTLADLCRARGWNYSWLSKIMNQLSPTPATFLALCQETFEAWDLESAVLPRTPQAMTTEAGNDNPARL
jgi:hypothetical protein